MISIFTPEGLKEVAKNYRSLNSNPFDIKAEPVVPTWKCSNAKCTYWRNLNNNETGGVCEGACMIG